MLYLRMETKFGILDTVWYLNTGNWKIESAKVMKVTVVPNGLSKDEKGEDVLEGTVTLYELSNRLVISEAEAFATREEVVEACRKVD